MTSHKHHGVSNHRQLDFLFNRFGLTRETSKLRITTHLVGKPPLTGGFPHKDQFECGKCFHLMTSSCISNYLRLELNSAKFCMCVHFLSTFDTETVQVVKIQQQWGQNNQSQWYTQQSVASFTKEVNSRLAKRPLVFNGRLANRGYWGPFMDYRQTSNISRTVVGNNIVDHSDVVGASPTRRDENRLSNFTLHFSWHVITDSCCD